MRDIYIYLREMEAKYVKFDSSVNVFDITLSMLLTSE